MTRKTAERTVTRNDLRKMMQAIKARRLAELSDDAYSEQGTASPQRPGEAHLKSDSGTGINVCIFPCNNAVEHVVSECLKNARHARTADGNSPPASTTNDINFAMCENLLVQVSEKIEALQAEMKLYESQNSHLKVLQQEYKQMLNKLQSERKEFEEYKQDEKRKLEAEIEEEKRKIRLQKKIRNCQHNQVTDLPHRQMQKRSEKTADTEANAQLQRKVKAMASENCRLKTKLELSEKEKESLKAMVKQLEEQRLLLLEKIEKMSELKHMPSLEKLLTSQRGDHVTSQGTSNLSTTRLRLLGARFPSEVCPSIKSAQGDNIQADQKSNEEVVMLSLNAESCICKSQEQTRCSPVRECSKRDDGDASESSVVISATLVARFSLDESAERVTGTSPPKSCSTPTLQLASRQWSEVREERLQSFAAFHGNGDTSQTESNETKEPVEDGTNNLQPVGRDVIQSVPISGPEFTVPPCAFKPSTKEAVQSVPMPATQSISSYQTSEAYTKITESSMYTALPIHPIASKPEFHSREVLLKTSNEAATHHSLSLSTADNRTIQKSTSSSSSVARVGIITKEHVCPTLVNRHKSQSQIAMADTFALSCQMLTAENATDGTNRALVTRSQEAVMQRSSSSSNVDNQLAQKLGSGSSSVVKVGIITKEPARLTLVSQHQRQVQTTALDATAPHSKIPEVDNVAAAVADGPKESRASDSFVTPSVAQNLLDKVEEQQHGQREAFTVPDAKMTNIPNGSSSSHRSDEPVECLRDILQNFQASAAFPASIPSKSRVLPNTPQRKFPDTQAPGFGQTRVNSLIKKYSHVNTAINATNGAIARKSRSVQLQCSSTTSREDRSPVGCASRTWALDSSGQKMFLTVVSKEIDPFTQVIVYKFQNGDQKDLHPDGKVVYRYAKSKTVHTILPCGDKEIKFANGQVETHRRNGDIEVIYPDGTVRRIFASGEEERHTVDGIVARTTPDGTETVDYPNGQREVRTDLYKSRYYPNGTVKTVYADGKQVTRYANGRVRIKDGDGTLLVLGV